jgi:dolichol-phosphate mannosyltransferase
MCPSAEPLTATRPTHLPAATVRLGVVCPLANEEETAVAFVEAVLLECRRPPLASVTLFAVLDTVSTDGTQRLLEELARRRPQVHVVWAPENRGVADAYVRGYREALAAGCDWILEIDGGFAHDPAQIPDFLAPMADGTDCVFGTRFAPGGADRATLGRRLLSRGGTALANRLLGTRLSDMTGGFELFSRPALERVLERGIRSRGPFFQTEVKTHCRGLRVAEVPITYDAGSHRVGVRAVVEALVGLVRLFGRRLRGEL